MATTSGATARMDMDGENGGDSVGLAMGGGELANSEVRQIGAGSGNFGLTNSGPGVAVAGTGVAAADRTGRTAAAATGAAAGRADRQGIAALEASLLAMLHSLTGNSFFSWFQA